MLRPKKRQKFGGFSLSERNKLDALQDEEEEQEAEEDREEPGGEPGAEKMDGAEKELTSDPALLKEGGVSAAKAAKPTLASLLAKAEAAAASSDVEAAFEPFSVQNDVEGTEEQMLLERLREAISKAFPGRQFEIEPAGSFVTGLRLPHFGGKSSRCDFEIALLFHDGGVEADDTQSEADGSMIGRVTAWLRTQPGTIIKEVFRKAHIPSVVFETKHLVVEISMQNPCGVLNSWHFRDLCRSGWPGRLRALAKLVKVWALSKSIDSVKDGALGPQGYELLAAAFLQECGATPALLPWTGSGPYPEPADALRAAVDASAGGAAECDLWRAPESTAPDFSEAASWHPTQFFLHWLDWMAETVLGFVESCKDVAGGCGKAPLERRHIVSVRDRTQEELREDVLASATAEAHWSPETREVFLLIEEPLSGANVGRCVWFKGFCAIRAEVQRARKFLEATAPSRAGLPNFQALLAMPALSRGGQPQAGPPAGGATQRPIRPLEDAANGGLPGAEHKASKASAASDICWDFARGNCKKGTKCKWLHSLDAAADKEDE